MRDQFEQAYAKIFMDCSGGDTKENRLSLVELRNGDRYDDEHVQLLWRFTVLIHERV